MIILYELTTNSGSFGSRAGFYKRKKKKRKKVHQFSLFNVYWLKYQALPVEFEKIDFKF